MTSLALACKLNAAQTLPSKVARMVAALRRIGGSLWMVDNAFSGSYIDNAGTTPVTAYADLLGLTTDRLGVLGPNVFSDALSCTFAGESVRVSPGVYRIYSSAGVYSAVSIGGGLQQNKTYRLRFYQDNAIAGALAINAPVGTIVPVVAGGVGWKECIVTMTSVVSLTIKRSSAATDIQISNVLIQELTGSHATQSAVASKPSVQRVPKRLGPELIASQDLTTWTSGGAFGNWGGTTSTATTITTTSIVGGRYVRMPCVPGKSYTFAALVAAGTGNGAVAIAYGTSGNTLISEQTGGFIASGVARLTTVAPANAAFVEFVVRGGASGQTATFTALSAGEVLEWANVISFDGSNDFLETGITTGNEGFVAAAVTFGGAAGANETVAVSGAGASTQKGVWLRRAGVSHGENAFVAGVCGGSTLYQAVVNSIPLRGFAHVVEGGWTTSSVYAAVDGVSNTVSKTGDATPPAATLDIGRYISGAHYMQGLMHAIAYTPILPDAADRKIIRDGIAALQGRGPL